MREKYRHRKPIKKGEREMEREKWRGRKREKERKK